MEFKITNTQVYGLDRAVKASGNPMRVEIDTSDVNDKDFIRATKLGTSKSGEGHDNFLKGILVQMDVTAPLFWWKQAQRYHWFDFVSSQSTMHCLLKFDVASQCVNDTNPDVVRLVAEMIAKYLSLAEDDAQKKTLWRQIVASLPCGFCLGATMTTNYQQLKTMYYQRRYHKLDEWHVFAKWCESLPHFQELVLNTNR
ncbi:MAG: hypothetical protein EOM77_02095 [Bacteroidia bacterium]|nr:hypothetical protein [Bacteroidia bacterium]